MQMLFPELSEPSKKPKVFFSNLLDELEATDAVPGWPDLFGESLRDHISPLIKQPIHVLSLFSGAGGLDIGFHDAGFSIVEMVEINPRYVATLDVNSQKDRKLEGSKPTCIDIREYAPPATPKIDFIIGGPPCQTFSAAGRRASGVSGLDDPRGRLFQEYVRILQTVKPKGFLFENVYGIVGAQGGKAWKEIVSAFEELGYKISYRILDAADYGVPQHRERLIIVGLKDGTFLFPRPTHGPDSPNKRPYYAAGLAVQNVDDEKPDKIGGRFGYLLDDIPPGLNYSFYTEKMGHPSPVFAWRSKFSDFLYKADFNDPVRTIKASGGQYTGPFHWENRPFSLGELKRLQTFPDNFELVGGRLVSIEQIGNSVPPQFGRMLALSVLSQIFGINLESGIELLSANEELGFRKRKSFLTKQYLKKANEALSKHHAKKNGINGHIAADIDHRMSFFYEGERVSLGYLGPQFEWFVEGETEEEKDWNICFSATSSNDKLLLKVGRDIKQFVDPALKIEIVSSNSWDKWPIPAKSVLIELEQLNPLLFTASWKALEFILAKEGIKADLVQLNGYYQYDPAIKAKVIGMQNMLDAGNPILWQALRHVIEGQGVRKLAHIGEIAMLWELELPAVVDVLMQLKELGYEVRSEYTNSQIPKDHILIPYAFPTLNPKSVQLRKPLFADQDLQNVLASIEDYNDGTNKLYEQQ